MIHYPYRRRQFFIKKEFQLKFILIYALTLVLIAGLTTWVLSLKIDRALEWHIYSSHLKVERTGEVISGLLLETNLVAILAIIGLVVLMSMIVIHRLNLHFYRMCDSIERTARGDFGARAMPRSKFNEISRLIDMVDDLKSRTSSRYETISEALEGVRRACAAGPDRDMLAQARHVLKSGTDKVALPDEG